MVRQPTPSASNGRNLGQKRARRRAQRRRSGVGLSSGVQQRRGREGAVLVSLVRPPPACVEMSRATTTTTRDSLRDGAAAGRDGRGSRCSLLQCSNASVPLEMALLSVSLSAGTDALPEPSPLSSAVRRRRQGSQAHMISTRPRAPLHGLGPMAIPIISQPARRSQITARERRRRRCLRKLGHAPRRRCWYGHLGP
jgi:hypothetical protein